MSLPFVLALPSEFSISDAFTKLHSIRGRVWFDSASRGPELEPGGDHAGRYSFLSADPVDRISAFPGDPTPWPQLSAWCDALPKSKIADLPPFQGGLAGLWGYEAGSWLEPVGHAQINDLPTPAISVGLYDWVICHDRLKGKSWLVSWGFNSLDFKPCAKKAKERASSVLDWLNQSTSTTLASDLLSDDSLSKREVADHSTFGLAPRFGTHWPGVWSNFSSADYQKAIRTIIESIRDGDSFQVNLSQRLLTKATCSSESLTLQLRQANPAPFAGYYDGGEFQVISSSPEGFLRLRNGVVQTRPIKGTAPRTGDDMVDDRLAMELGNSEKDRAENVMIVDLMRNDLSRVCEDESVRVNQLCGTERYAHVQHLVSVVEGRLRPGVSAIDMLAACFPGGSVTGAPKIEAMRAIASLEPNARGPYCGSLGYISCGGDAEFNILIRTITATRDLWQIPVGGGITLKSDPPSEERETWVKAEGMLRAIRYCDNMSP